MNKREIEIKFNKLLTEVKSDVFYTRIDLTNRVNCYKCNCGHITKTKDIDAGVTPMISECEKCGGMATSSGFTDIAKDKEPTQEWYRPDLKELLAIKNPALVDHVLRGGLMKRQISEKKQIVYILEQDDYEAIHLDVDALIEQLKTEYEGYNEEDHLEMTFKISAKYMTETEIANLPEFDGF